MGWKNNLNFPYRISMLTSFPTPTTPKSHRIASVALYLLQRSSIRRNKNFCAIKYQPVKSKQFWSHFERFGPSHNQFALLPAPQTSQDVMQTQANGKWRRSPSTRNYFLGQPIRSYLLSFAPFPSLPPASPHFYTSVLVTLPPGAIMHSFPVTVPLYPRRDL